MAKILIVDDNRMVLQALSDYLEEDGHDTEVASNGLDALEVLAPWIKHVHIKDATATQVPGEWGAEVAWGNGDVDTAAFLAKLEEIGYTGALAIEREAGDSRMEDIQLAATRLKKVAE